VTQGQRYQIEMGLACKQSQAGIAKQLGVHPATISREIRRNGRVRGSGLAFCLLLSWRQKTRLDPLFRWWSISVLRCFSGRLRWRSRRSARRSTVDGSLAACWL